MDGNHIFSFLRSLEFFADLPDTALEHLTSFSRVQQYKRNEFVFFQGEDRNESFLVLRGAVKIVQVDKQGREFIHNVTGVGHLFPAIGFFCNETMPGSAQSLDKTSLIAISQPTLEDILMEHPLSLKRLVQEMNRRIYDLYQWQQKLAVCDSSQRIHSLLFRLATEYGKVQSDGIHVYVPITQLEAAQMVGITRESVNRIWTRLRKQSILRSNENNFILSQEWYDLMQSEHTA